MSIYKTRWFDRWARKEGLNEATLRDAATELERGMADALGGYVFKKRVALPGRGRRGGARTLVAYRRGSSTFFIYGYPKNERATSPTVNCRHCSYWRRSWLSYSEQQRWRNVKR